MRSLTHFGVSQRILSLLKKSLNFILISCFSLNIFSSNKPHISLLYLLSSVCSIYFKKLGKSSCYTENSHSSLSLCFPPSPIIPPLVFAMFFKSVLGYLLPFLQLSSLYFYCFIFRFRHSLLSFFYKRWELGLVPLSAHTLTLPFFSPSPVQLYFIWVLIFVLVGLPAVQSRAWTIFLSLPAISSSLS